MVLKQRTAKKGSRTFKIKYSFLAYWDCQETYPLTPPGRFGLINMDIKPVSIENVNILHSNYFIASRKVKRPRSSIHYQLKSSITEVLDALDKSLGFDFRCLLQSLKVVLFV